MEAVFAIPILAIPIGGKSATTQESQTTLPKVDINLKSIISMAGIFFLLFFVLPKLVQIYLPQKLSPNTLQNPGNLFTLYKKLEFSNLLTFLLVFCFLFRPSAFKYDY